jgi:mono/diheme cytochrome c family protein
MRRILIPGNACRSVAVVFLLMVINGCGRTRNDTGWDYFPDMFYSTAYETYAPNPNFRDGMTMRTPVEGTVPRGYTPFHYTNDPESRILAGKELFNPFSADPENISRGKDIYTTFCLVCHGETGSGDGHLYKSGLYPLQPRNLTDSESVGLKDGEIFHTITVGYSTMGAHGAQIQPDDRWKLVLYVRELQKEAAGSPDGGEK